MTLGICPCIFNLKTLSYCVMRSMIEAYGVSLTTTLRSNKSGFAWSRTNRSSEHSLSNPTAQGNQYYIQNHGLNTQYVLRVPFVKFFCHPVSPSDDVGAQFHLSKAPGLTPQNAGQLISSIVLGRHGYIEASLHSSEHWVRMSWLVSGVVFQRMTIYPKGFLPVITQETAV